MPRTWSAVLARLGVPTGDKRIIAPGALTNRDLPLPLMWQRVSDAGHSGSVTVGAIETLTIDNENGIVTATGRFLEVRGAAEAQAQTDAGVTGPSIDIFDDVDIREVQTLIEAGVVGPNLLDNMDDIEYAMDADGMVVITNGRIAGATLVQIPAFAEVSIDLLDTEEERDPLYASATVATPKVLPPLAWFAKPDLDRLTPLTISDSGRIFGHIAGRDTCHVGLPGCVTPPMGRSDYSHFHVGAQEVQPGSFKTPTETLDVPEGFWLPVGTLVAGPRHADPQLAFRAAQEHYDDVDAEVAKVVAGEDEFGIWVAGWMLPGAKLEAVEVFKSSPVSGDWRWVGGQLELIAVCSVNTPGFPVPRARVAFSSGAQRTLVASFGVTPQEGEETPSVRPETLELARAKWAWATTEGR